MNDAQTWTLIAGFLAIIATMVGMTLRVVRTEIAGLDVRLSGRIDRLDDRIDAVEQRLGGKIDQLDRDVQTVINRLMGG